MRLLKMKSIVPIVCLVLSTWNLTSGESLSAETIDALIAAAEGQQKEGDWAQLQDFKTWQIKRFLTRSSFFDHTDRYRFLTARGKKFEVVVQSSGGLGISDLNDLGNKCYIEFENKRYRIHPGSAEEKSVFRVLNTTPKIPRLKKSRRYQHVRNLLDVFSRETDIPKQ